MAKINRGQVFIALEQHLQFVTYNSFITRGTDYCSICRPGLRTISREKSPALIHYCRTCQVNRETELVSEAEYLLLKQQAEQN